MQTTKSKKNKNYKNLGLAITIDLVCGMELDENNIKASTDYKDKTYYFCAIHCKNHFTSDPAKYVGE